MSVYSMTSYASGQQAAPKAEEGSTPPRSSRLRLALEMRSVNSRFLDLQFRLPDELRHVEPALRDLLVKRLKRGKVELRAYIEGRDASGLQEPSPRALQRLSSMQDQVRAWLPEAPALSVADVLRLAVSPEDFSTSSIAEGALPLAQTVLDEFVKARAREGARLSQLLELRLTELRRLAREAEPLIPKAIEGQTQRFLARWNEALAGVDNAPPAAAAQERALNEATAFAIRIDVSEELGRLISHLDEIEAILKKGGEVGKRLDFLIQELHREANTLGSKSTVLELTRISVDMKVLIEQMREQVQNIE
ncbi:YicC/YloC family endoribonuclease [Ottowia thiooxydans]|uniref:YicC/YloC family endoribonuclease n=1 Tax=Ottowia thiooxydans TaxID=219182 RepID=UPI0004914C42|nr:YicC/YloC family endoribonuclease [Ottowia thiooxydans]